MKGRILITGANGFIGFHLTETAIRSGYKVDAAIRKGSDTVLLNTLDNSDMRFVYPDYTSVENLTDLIKQNNYDYIIHCAGATKAPNMNAYNKVNVDYSINLADASLNSGTSLKRFVFISSLAALGPISYTQQTPIDENSIAKPVTSYGRSKLIAEQKLSAIEELPLTIIRPTAVYGPAEKDLFVLFQMFNRGLECYIGRQPQLLSFVYVKDLVSAIMGSLKIDAIKKRSYNISDGKAYQRYELAEVFKKVTGSKTIKLHIPESLIKVIATGLEGISGITGKTSVLNREKISELTAQNWNCSIAAAVSDLHYQPQNSLASGIAETIEWYKVNKWLN